MFKRIFLGFQRIRIRVVGFTLDHVELVVHKGSCGRGIEIATGAQHSLFKLFRICIALGISSILHPALSSADSPSIEQNSDDKRPNILMILVDDLGYGDLGCMGSKEIVTPGIDAIFDSGVKFTQFYSNCTVCAPSRASLLTGKFPDKVGVPGVIRQDPKDTWGNLDTSVPTIARLLSDSGYDTALIGKWHLGLESPNTPNERGFDYFKGFLGDMMNDYWTHLREGVNWMRHNGEIIDPEGHATDLFAEWSCDYIESRTNESDPFFLYLAFNAPHDPVQPPADWLQKVKQRFPEMSEKRAKLVAFIEHMDAAIETVTHALESNDLSRDTIVVFSSDNGGALQYGADNGPLNGGKGDHFEGGIRVPTAMSWPGVTPSGSSTDMVTMMMDLFPTFCEVAGMKFDSLKVDGISLLETIKGESQIIDDRTLFWVRQEGNMRFGGRTYYAARRGDYKLLQNTPFEPYSLYNLKTDPLEQNPLPLEGSEYEFLFRELMEHIRITTID